MLKIDDIARLGGIAMFSKKAKIAAGASIFALAVIGAVFLGGGCPPTEPVSTQGGSYAAVKEEAFRFTKDDGKASEIASYVEDASNDTGVPPELLASVIELESGFDASAVSDNGAVGLMQVGKERASELGLDASKPADNVLAGARILQECGARGNVRKAAGCYYDGKGKTTPAGEEYAERAAKIMSGISAHGKI